MPALIITAVDNTTERLTSVAHGLNTGDGPAAIFAGAGGVIPTGLASVTDYWVIKTTVDTFQLASSSANAFANTPINITTNGTLPLSLLVGLPYRVPMTAAPGAQIKSANDNAAWLALVSLWNFLTGQAQSIWAGITLAANQNITLSGTGMYKRGTRVRHLPGSAGVLTSAPAAATSYYSGSFFVFASTANTVRYSLVLEEGEQLQSVRGYTACGATSVLTMKVFRNNNPLTVGVIPPGDAQLGATQTSANHAQQLEQLAVTGLSDGPAATIAAYTAEFDCSAFGATALVVGVDFTTVIP